MRTREPGSLPAVVLPGSVAGWTISNGSSPGAARTAAAHRRSVGDRPVVPERSSADIRAAFGGPLPDGPSAPDRVIDELLSAADGSIVGSVGPRFFGFVTGGALPAATAADVLALGWDQAAFNEVLAPAAGAAEQAAGSWVKELLGLGTDSLESIRSDAQGAIDVDHLEEVLASGGGVPTIVALQAGNVNTGACDDFARAVPLARQHAGWVHVDGAFGLWAAASPRFAHLTRGVELADSWGTDAHKWLNVPYDSGLAFCRDPELHASTMSYRAAYLTRADDAPPLLGDLTPESSRRARGFAVWAALRELGRHGVAGLVDRCCDHARTMAELLAAGGARIHNDVVLNQVLVGFGSSERTDAVVEAVQRDGTCWVGATTWRGERLMRVSVSGWTTTGDDIERSAEAVLRCAAAT